MKNHVAGISLTDFEDPIRVSLQNYSDMTDGKVVFDLEEAFKLRLTPDEPYSAGNVTPVKHLGDVAATLQVIAFAPKDGTGGEETYKLSDIDTGEFPPAAKIVPRPKANVHSEGHLTIASSAIDAPNNDPAMFAGNLDLLGLAGNTVTALADLGQNRHTILDCYTRRPQPASPRATLTVGYRGALEGLNRSERFADPHAVYNPWRGLVQVCGFIAISPEAAPQHLDLLRLLNAKEPQFL